jgi:hypothetical protein
MHCYLDENKKTISELQLLKKEYQKTIDENHRLSWQYSELDKLYK